MSLFYTLLYLPYLLIICLSQQPFNHPNTYLQKSINDATPSDVNLLNVPVTSSSFQTFSSASFSQISSIYIILVWQTVSHPCRIISKILIFTLLAAAGNIKCYELNCSKHSPDLSVLLTCVWMQFWFATIRSYPYIFTLPYLSFILMTRPQTNAIMKRLLIK